MVQLLRVVPRFGSVAVIHVHGLRILVCVHYIESTLLFDQFVSVSCQEYDRDIVVERVHEIFSDQTHGFVVLLVLGADVVR